MVLLFRIVFISLLFNSSFFFFPCSQEEGEETPSGGTETPGEGDDDDDDTAGVAADEAKLSDIYGRLGQIGAASAEARAATILNGLGFSTDVQVRFIHTYIHTNDTVRGRGHAPREGFDTYSSRVQQRGGGQQCDGGGGGQSRGSVREGRNGSDRATQRAALVCTSKKLLCNCV